MTNEDEDDRVMGIYRAVVSRRHRSTYTWGCDARLTAPQTQLVLEALIGLTLAAYLAVELLIGVYSG